MVRFLGGEAYVRVQVSCYAAQNIFEFQLTMLRGKRIYNEFATKLDHRSMLP